MKFKHSKEFTIGLSVIVALVLLYTGIEYLKGNNIFKPANYYYATFEDVAGLSQSAPVTLNGFKVGLVREIAYDYEHPGNVKVEISLDKELRLPDGTQAILATDMLGTASIDLKLGKSNKYYNSGDEIPGIKSAGLMSNVTDNILPAVSNVMTKIDSLLTSLNAVVSNPAINGSLDNLQDAMINIKAGSAQLATAMNSLPALTSDAKTTMTNVRQMSESLNTIAGDLTTVATQIKEIPLEQTMQNIYQTSQSLKEMMAQINNKNSTLGKLLNDTELYDNLNNASASLDSLLIDVKKNPKRYISIKLL
ncbi:MAG: MlaD family protein [Bacteroides sp.]|nr:MlaD family protein [Bacteroides sp.]MCM1413346.1 MlaD family protein [Bacteroides sp.]MCM1471968.1 MlaD family protein [Bacteroides sp.]